MPPTTRANAHKAAGGPTPYMNSSAAQRQAASPILGGSMNPLVPAASPSQHVSASTSTSSPRASVAAASQPASVIDSSPPPLDLQSPILGNQQLGDSLEMISANTSTQAANPLGAASSSTNQDLHFGNMWTFDGLGSLNNEARLQNIQNSAQIELAGYNSNGVDLIQHPLLGSSSPTIQGFSSSPAATAPSHIPTTKMDTDNSIVADRPSSQAVVNSSRTIMAATPPTLRSVIDSSNPRSAAIISERQVLGDITRNIVLPQNQRRSSAMMITSLQNIPQPDESLFPAMIAHSLEDVDDPIVRNQVSNLQQLHPWASIKLCHSMLVRCRSFVDASTTLRKMAGREIPNSKDENPILPALPAAITKFSTSSSLNASFDGAESDGTDGFEGLDSFDGFNLRTSTSSFSGQPFKPLSTSTSTSTKLAKGQVGSKIDSGQQLLSFSKAIQQQPGLFSRGERERVIASSTETSADRERVSFMADAVIYRALSTPEYSYGWVTKAYAPRRYLTTFPMTPGPFPQPSEKYVPSQIAYKGTNRGKFQPLSFDTPDDGKVVLQSISLAFPYVRTSFEELRLGDYIRERKKAPHLFDLFCKLPAEIRCMIWRWAMPPRTVELRFNSGVDRCWTVSKVPVTLRVCSESRYEALKVYTLAFGIHANPDKIYFNFLTDTLFFTFEKWHGDGEYEDQVEILAYYLGQNKETKKIRSLAIDRELLEIFARRLEDEEEEWYDEGDDEAPMPEIDVIPAFKSLESLVIVKPSIDGLWEHNDADCECGGGKNCEVKKRGKKNDNAVFEVVRSSSVANKTQQEYYKQLIVQVKEQNPDWKVPELSYMVKRVRPSKLVSKAARGSCPCGGGCWDGSD